MNAILFLILAILPFSSVGATAPACQPSCAVDAGAGGFTPPVVLADDGATVTWAQSSGIHSTSADTNSCWDGTLAPRLDAVRITFDLVNGIARAHQGSVTRDCSGAVDLPDGSVAIPYHCRFHASMHGVIVVRPSAFSSGSLVKAQVSS